MNKHLLSILALKCERERLQEMLDKEEHSENTKTNLRKQILGFENAISILEKSGEANEQ